MRHVPGIRAALDLESAGVSRAFERVHGRPLASVYAQRIPWPERLRWLRSRAAHRLESLPPFWTAFALTLTETVGAGILALPIALAEIGPIGGLIVILVLGLVNLLTIAAMAEAVARNGNVRYGHAYFGRLVTDYLGCPGIWILAPALILLFSFFLFAYYVGLSSTLADATSVPAEVWAALLFVVGLIFLRRERLDATVASALVVGATTIGLILLLSLLALPHVSSVNLRHSAVPFVSGEPFDASLLELIFGVVLGAYFGHTSAANCAAVVLQRDPSARSYIRGSVAALAVAAALYSIWIIGVNGAVSAAALSGETGTALEPLADVVGSSVLVLGSIFAVLAMGMASIHMSLGLSKQTREWLPGARDEAHRHRDFWVGILPVATIFLIVEGLLFSDRASFTSAVGIVSTITVPVLAGVFPMAMIVASRRKGDCALGPVWRLVGNPVVAAATSMFFFAALVLHGTVIWEGTLERGAALVVSAATGVAMVIAIRQGAFQSRTVVELRVGSDPVDPPVVDVVAHGRAVFADVRFTFFESDSRSLFSKNEMAGSGSLRSALIELPPAPVQELKVWAHRLTPEGESERLPATVVLRDQASTQEFDLKASAGQLIVPIMCESHQLEIVVEKRAAT
jgi:amino acid permease